MENKKKGFLFVISGPSGVGKTTLSREVISRMEKDFDISKVITYTTRPKRENEVDSKDYYFLSFEEFDKKFKDDFFLETTKYDGHMYGSPKSVLNDIKLGKSFVIVIDNEGMKNISNMNQHDEDIAFIWIDPPSIKELERRILKRSGHNKKMLSDRISLAEQEIKDAHGKKRIINYFLVNDVFEKSVNALEKIIRRVINGEFK